jgi:toxin-antitoxin system PIN domain toxin
MLIPDVNILLTAHRRDSPDHQPAHAWLTAALGGAEVFGVFPLVLSAVVRIATNPRVYTPASTPDEALSFCADVLRPRTARVVSPSGRHWEIFADLVRSMRARANDVPDAYLAALAIEQGATFVTRDRGFHRFATLRVLDPLAP